MHQNHFLLLKKILNLFQKPTPSQINLNKKCKKSFFIIEKMLQIYFKSPLPVKLTLSKMQTKIMFCCLLTNLQPGRLSSLLSNDIERVISISIFEIIFCYWTNSSNASALPQGVPSRGGRQHRQEAQVREAAQVRHAAQLDGLRRRPRPQLRPPRRPDRHDEVLCLWPRRWELQLATEKGKGGAVEISILYLN